jgi:regulator of protease activity HflC (stomatin/prohibitin superfamily)
MNAPLTWILLTFATLAVLSLKRVPEGHAYTVHRFGSYRRTLNAGLHWILPLVDRIAHRVSLNGRSLTLTPNLLRELSPEAPALHGRLYFQVLDAARADPDADHLDEVVLDTLGRALRERPTLLAQPPAEVNQQLKPLLNAELKLHGVAVIRCQIDRQPPRATDPNIRVV